MADQPESEGRHRAKRPLSRDRPVRASEETIKAVSGLLAEKKAELDRPPTPAKVALPEVSRSLDEILRRSEDLPDARSKSVDSPITLEPPPVRLPDGGPPEGPSRSDHPGPGPGGLVPTPGGPTTPAVAVEGGSALVGRDALSAAPPASRSVGPGGGASESSRSDRGLAARIVPEAAKVVAGEGWRADGVVGDPPPQDEAGPTRRPDSVGVSGEESRPARSGNTSSSKAIAVDLPREPGVAEATTGSRERPGLAGSGAVVSTSAIAVDHGPRTASHAEPSATVVRNPLSADLKNLSLAGSPSSEASGLSPGRGGTGRESVDDSFGQATSSQGGTAVDLSKTNELLQQLIDAVRKQRGSSLPIGGPPAYPER